MNSNPRNTADHYSDTPNEFSKLHTDHEIASQEVEDIFERTPSWVLRYGITTIGSLILFLFVGSIFIRYPDVIITRILITTVDPPINIVARNSGKIRFFVSDGERIKKNSIVAAIESTVTIGDVFRLAEELKKIQTNLFQRQITPELISLSENLQVGTLQGNYQQLLTSIRNIELDQKSNLFQAQIKSLNDRIQQHLLLDIQLQRQGEIQNEELLLMEKKYLIDEKLFQENVIAVPEFNTTKITYLQLKRAAQLAENNIVNNRIAIAELKSRVVEISLSLQENAEQLSQDLRNAFKQMESQLSVWEQEYVLSTPIDGRVSIFDFLTDEQYVTSGTNVLAVLPETNDIYGQVQMQIGGSGKVEVGQRVVIKLDNYPSNEYGTISGVVKEIAALPKNNIYTIRIKLPNGLFTSYKKELPFKQQLSGSAEIITKDLSLFQRFFLSIKYLMDSTTTM